MLLEFLKLIHQIYQSQKLQFIMQNEVRYLIYYISKINIKRHKNKIHQVAKVIKKIKKHKKIKKIKKII